MPKKYGLHFLEKWSRDEGDVCCCCYVLHCFIASKIGMVVVVGFPAPLLPAAVEKKVHRFVCPDGKTISLRIC